MNMLRKSNSISILSAAPVITSNEHCGWCDRVIPAVILPVIWSLGSHGMDLSVLSECHPLRCPPITYQGSAKCSLLGLCFVVVVKVFRHPSTLPLNILYNDAMASFSFSLRVACIPLKVQQPGHGMRRSCCTGN